MKRRLLHRILEVVANLAGNMAGLRFLCISWRLPNTTKKQLIKYFKNMQYPLYDYYSASNMTLEEIMEHYIKNFYLRKHGRDKVEKVASKISDSSKMKKLFDQSLKQRIAPNYIDFGSVINEMMYFMFQSNSTQALAVLAAAIAWDKQVNSLVRLKNQEALRDDAIKIFKKFSIYEEMTKSEFEEMTCHF